ncbi:YjjG family noncanonical pyrimidine nucleotidase [uncultured Croceitalea sp.]|uniref:YjjG family noncanonical pyrimidine nucleotidase n=1 Tax=uncultured Croceitalea sp. TaxID=1798908 RepID=UPI0033068F24
MFENQVTDVFFDLDHTLWDFEKNSALTFKKIFLENGMSIVLDDFLQEYVPINLAYWKLYREERVTKKELRYQRLKKTFDLLNMEVSNEMIHRLSIGYIEHLSSFNHVFPGTMEVLEYLKPKYRLHIITNGFEEIQEKKMKNANIHQFFDIVINSEMAGVKKPNPIIFELALQKASTEAVNSLMIGDSLEADIIGAKNLGFHTIHFNSHGEPPHEICETIHHLNEIKNFL